MAEKHHVVVDGSNLATEGRTDAEPRPARRGGAGLRRGGSRRPRSWWSSTPRFEHRIDPAEREQLEQAELHGEVVSPPAGAIGRGDAFVLRIAERTGAVVLSNDSFQEFHGEHPWLFDDGPADRGQAGPGRRLDLHPRIPVRGPKSRQATGKAKRDSTRRAAELPAPVKAAELAKAARRSARAAKKVGGRTPQVGDVWPPPVGTAPPEPVAEPPEAPAPAEIDQTPAEVLALETSHEVEGPTGPAEKVPAKKTPAKKAAAKKTAAKKAPAKRAPAKKIPAKKVAAKKAPATKAPATKAPAAKKVAAKTPAAKKAARAVGTKRAPAAKAAAGSRATAGVDVLQAAADESLPVPPPQSVTAPVVLPTEGPTGAIKPAPTGRRRRAPLPVAVDEEILAAIDEALVEVLAPAPQEPPKTKGKGKGKADGRAKSDKTDNGPKRRRRSTPPPAVNETLAFINFVATFPVGGELEGEVASFTSHGAMVDVALPQGGMLHCYIPLAAMADPPPRKAREVLTKGERRPFVLTSLDPPRRVAELAVPGVTTGLAPA